MNDNLIILLLKLPRNTEVTPEAAKTFLSALTQINPLSALDRLLGKKPKAFALEIALINQQIGFMIVCDPELVPFVETQIQSNYPLAIIEKIKDPLVGQVVDYVKVFLRQGNNYPIATFDKFQDIDPLSSVLSVLAQSEPDEITIIQYALQSVDSSWQAKGKLFAEQGVKNENGTYSARPDANIKNKDRLRHIWTVGKTGTGKSTMIANMVIDDFKKGRGVAVIDPHGDLCDDILDYIPRSRINDTVYFNPADREYPIVINPLEVTNREEAELVASGLMSIFTKVWANVWSARMEYILRNCFMTLSEVEN